MTQQLATATKAGKSWPLDFGTLAADKDGFLVVTRGKYVMSYAPDIKLADVAVSDVADDYAIAAPAPVVDPATQAWLTRWGKRDSVTPDQFPGLVMKAFLGLYQPAGQTAEQVLDRLARLWGDVRVTSIRQTLSSATLKKVDPNDATGNFRTLVGILRTTKATGDGLPLLVDAEEAAIAAAFPLKGT